MDLVLNNQQGLICHKTQPTNQPTIWYLAFIRQLVVKKNSGFNLDVSSLIIYRISYSAVVSYNG